MYIVYVGDIENLILSSPEKYRSVEPRHRSQGNIKINVKKWDGRAWNKFNTFRTGSSDELL